MECKLCSRVLASHNKSGYCTGCYKNSPQYLEYQRGKQKEFYYKYKDRKIAYNNLPHVKKRREAYHKKLVKENPERNRQLKNEWARKNRLKLKGEGK